MSYLKAFLLLVCSIIIIGCTIYNDALKKREIVKTHVFDTLTPSFIDKKIELPLISIKEKEDTLRDTLIINQSIINNYHQVDTTQLKIWLEGIYNDSKYRSSVMDDPRFVSMVDQLSILWREYDLAIEKLILTMEEKENAEIIVEKAKNIPYFIATFALVILLSILGVGSIMVKKQQVLINEMRTKIGLLRKNREEQE